MIHIDDRDRRLKNQEETIRILRRELDHWKERAADNLRKKHVAQAVANDMAAQLRALRKEA